MGRREDGISVGSCDGGSEETKVGANEGTIEGTAVGTLDCKILGRKVGTAEGLALGDAVGTIAIDPVTLNVCDVTEFRYLMETKRKKK